MALVPKGNYLLVTTDGYSLDDYTFYDELSSAQEAMRKAYESFSPEELNEAEREMSWISEMDAILYNNGEDVFVWQIIPIMKSGRH